MVHHKEKDFAFNRAADSFRKRYTFQMNHDEMHKLLFDIDFLFLHFSHLLRLFFHSHLSFPYINVFDGWKMFVPRDKENSLTFLKQIYGLAITNNGDLKSGYY